MTITINMDAPDFALPDEKNVVHRLSDYRGQPVVLYFYPKDDTSGCTTEACGFRDDYSGYNDEKLVILGVSPDSPESHAKFKTKYDLPFTLLADDGHKVCDLYGVWGLKKNSGREYEGVFRTTFLIDSAGKISKIFEKVSPAGHSMEVLEAAKSLA